MSDEPRMIEALAGPYKGQRLTMPAADADQAISDGWARDPFAPASDKPAKEPSEEERQAMLDKADKAARKLRGEEIEEEKPSSSRRKAMEAEQPSQTYETREARNAAPAHKARR